MSQQSALEKLSEEEAALKLAKQLEPTVLRRVTKVRDRNLLGLPALTK